jgi:hypothetical protein
MSRASVKWLVTLMDGIGGSRGLSGRRALNYLTNVFSDVNHDSDACAATTTGSPGSL